MSYIRSRKHVAVAPALKTTAAATMLAFAMPTYAAEETVLPSVSVTASQAPYKADVQASPKATAPLVDTPQTVTVIKKELLQEQGATTLQEALRNTPGVTLLLGEGGNTNTKDNIFMRGFDTSGNIYSDGIRDLGAYVRDTFNTESIEVLKGASGSENGRSAPSGSVNQVSKLPQATDFNAANLTFGTAGQKRATADLNRKLSEGVAARLNLMVQNSDVAGRDEVKNQGWGFAPSITIGMGSATRTTFSYIHSEQDNIPDGGIPTIGLSGWYAGTTLDPQLKAAGVVPKAVDRSNFYGSPDDYAKVKADQFTIALEHDFSKEMTLRNTFRAGKSEFDQLLTSPSAVISTGPRGSEKLIKNPDLWTASRSFHARSQDNVLVTNQTNLSVTAPIAGMENTLSAGVELIYEQQDSPTIGGLGTAIPANLYQPDSSKVVINRNVMPTGAGSKGDVFTVGVYAFDTLKLNDQWQLHGGLRFDRYSAETTTVKAAAADNAQKVPVGTLLTSTVSDADTLFSGKLGVVYKPLPNGSVYASVATSQQPPGGANFTLNATPGNINNPNMEPSKATNLELGTKWEFLDNQFMVSAAWFDTRVENDLTRTVEGNIEQYGEKRVRGIELGAVGNITSAWSISAGLAKMDTEVKEGASTQTGSQLNWSPELTFTAWTSYKLPMGLTIGGGVRYVDSMVRSVSNTAQAATTNMLTVSDYWVVDMMASYVVNKNVSVRLNVYNLADEEYIGYLNNNGNRYIPGAARSATLSGDFKF